MCRKLQLLLLYAYLIGGLLTTTNRHTIRVKTEKLLIRHRENILLICTVADFSLDLNMSVTWTKNGNRITNNYTVFQTPSSEMADHLEMRGQSAGEYNLHISNFQDDDSGVYKCGIINTWTQKFVSKSKSLHLEFIGERQLPICSTSVKNSANVVINTPVHMKCKIAKNGEPIKLGWTTSDNSNLYSTTMQFTEDGDFYYSHFIWTPSLKNINKPKVFKCHAEYPSHILTTDEVTSCSLGPFHTTFPPIVKIQRIENDNTEWLTFKCEAESNTDILSYTWKFDGVPVCLSDVGYIVECRGNILRIPTRGHGIEVIECEAENKLGMGFDSFTVDASPNANIIIENEAGKGIGSDSFSVDASPNANLVIESEAENELGEGSDSYTVDANPNANLVIESETENQQGVSSDSFIVDASPNANANLELQVKIVNLVSAKIYPTEIASFYCRVEKGLTEANIPPIQYKWYLDSVYIHPRSKTDRFIFENEEAVVHVTQISADDNGKVLTCDVSNSAMTVSDSTTLNVYSPDIAPTVCARNFDSNSDIIIKIPTNKNVLEIEKSVPCSESAKSEETLGLLSFVIQTLIARLVAIFTIGTLTFTGAMCLALYELRGMKLKAKSYGQNIQQPKRTRKK